MTDRPGAACPVLIVLGGLPATGKSTVARLVCRAAAIPWVRIDTIEQALRDSGELPTGPVHAGYDVGYALAADLLGVGRAVLVECVNPLTITRRAWREVAGRCSARPLEVELVCSDRREHRRRVEGRTVDVPGLVPPDWDRVRSRHYEPWDRDHLVLDTAALDPPQAARAILQETGLGVSVPTGEGVPSPE